jgi:hypothetical protein
MGNLVPSCGKTRTPYNSSETGFIPGQSDSEGWLNGAAVPSTFLVGIPCGHPSERSLRAIPCWHPMSRVPRLPLSTSETPRFVLCLGLSDADRSRLSEEAHRFGWQVRYAVDIEEARQRTGERTPDLVLFSSATPSGPACPSRGSG